MRRAEPAACDDLRRMSPCQSAALNGLEGQFQRAVVLVDSVGTGRAPAGLLRHHHSDGKQVWLMQLCDTCLLLCLRHPTSVGGFAPTHCLLM